MRRVARAPAWVQTLAKNFVALIEWIGLPAAVLAFFTDRRWVIDAAKFLYDHAGFAQAALLQLGKWITDIVHIWRSIYIPIQWLFAWINVEIPNWIFDIGSIILLLAVGQSRYWTTYVQQTGELHRQVTGVIDREVPWPYRDEADFSGILDVWDQPRKSLAVRQKTFVPKATTELIPKLEDAARRLVAMRLSTGQTDLDAEKPLVDNMREDVHKQADELLAYYQFKTGLIKSSYRTAAAICMAIVILDWLWIWLIAR